MEKQRIIIDCDPGIDDSLALLYALKNPKLDVLAITIVAGNVPVDLGAKNAFKCLELTNRTDIPIYIGNNKPLVREFISAQDTHGMDGLGETHLPISSNFHVQTKSAWEFLADYFSKEQNTAIISLGPLTNIAKALKMNKKLGVNCTRFVSMGGSFKSHGNCSPVAEYNYWCDPDAAQYTYHHLGKKIEMVGLDVTRHIVLTPNHLEYMSRLNPKMTNFISSITRFYFDFHWQYEHIIGCVINDPLAVAYFITNNLCQGFNSWTEVAVDGIAMGQTIVDEYHFYHKEDNSLILTSVDTTAFWIEFLTVVLEVDKDTITKDLTKLHLN